MAKKKIEALTPEQQEMLPRFREEWLRWGTCTERADRAKAERAILAMRARIGVTEAPVFVWCDSPTTSLLALHFIKSPKFVEWCGGMMVSLGDSLYASLRASLSDSLRASLSASLRDSLGDSLGASLGASLRASLRASLGASLGASLLTRRENHDGISVACAGSLSRPGAAVSGHVL